MNKHVTTIQTRPTNQPSEAEIAKKLVSFEANIRRVSSFYLDREVLPLARLRRDKRTVNNAIRQMRSVAREISESSKGETPLLQKVASLYLNATVLLSYLEGAAKGDLAQDGSQAMVDAINDPVMGDALRAEIMSHGPELLFIGGFAE